MYVEETQALVNFLLNSDVCTSKIGPMAGIPPTLLAPTAFLGGTLQPLKVNILFKKSWFYYLKNRYIQLKKIIENKNSPTTKLINKITQSGLLLP